MKTTDKNILTRNDIMTRNGETGFDVMFGGTMTGRMGRPEAEWRRIVAETVGRWFGTEPQIRSRG